MSKKIVTYFTSFLIATISTILFMYYTVWAIFAVSYFLNKSHCLN